ELYEKFKPSIRWGVMLLGLLLLAPAHPFGVIGQLFFYIFPFAFIFGPFVRTAIFGASRISKRELAPVVWTAPREF
ncbi:MAG: hypothetical protein KJ914_18820, partial [Gammaproteobacteria bacterium]|nr:hypothetical protein [Gammaproteobacteria bacterium]